MSIFSGDAIGVDLGSANTTIYLDGEGLALREATQVLSLRSDSQKVLAVGDKARALLGRTAEEVMLFSPVMDGAVTDTDVAALLVLALTEKATGRRKPMEKVRLFLSMSQGVTRVERLALEQTARLAGARRAYLVKTPLAAALGAGLDTEQMRGTMVAVLGGGTCEIAILSMNAIVAARSMRNGSFSMDEAIVRYVRRKKMLAIGARTAEDIKCDIGSAELPDYDAEDYDEDYTDEYDDPDKSPDPAGGGLTVAGAGEENGQDEPCPMEGERVLLKGRDARTGKPATITVTTRDIALALREPVRILVDALRDALSRTPPELAADILESGIHLSGGGALLPGLGEVLSTHTGVPVTISEHPQDDVALGLGRLMDDERLLRACIEAGSVEE